ncbi:5-methylcytosine restriction system component-like protein [Sulfuricurvum kujiense DSM 16994]|uniref:5-methylcytosine restriction system component-like protein n=1 Tax=Sulfuricurvum kujiense (strain ATCC BAA-921 / DSM 16994 / JCM 11577 / YK-1) TaxID=709032 RepID=E4U0W7_SULKY|nr:5-methylcytosine restriction system component-like protein [Sulfuricurvum kujiense]ADR34369.1 5-methylcytosine restriction system component-like protein [Sulfuricurvum kujiense DSM 16994]
MQVKAKEHEIINQSINPSKIAVYNQEFLKNSAKYLGIHQELNEMLEPVMKSHYFIGCRWLEEELYIHVSPKEYNGEFASYLSMFIECLDDPIVSQKLNDTYEIFFNEKWIDIKSSEDYLTPFLILHFLQIVKKITLKGLKKGYVTITENMTSKVKGKILINQTIKTNHFKNRLDKTVCKHQVFTVNCIENQIIKTALIRCMKYLSSISNNEEILRTYKQNTNAFELVEVCDVLESDFSSIKHSPFYKDYKQALELAKMIFKRFGFVHTHNDIGKSVKIPPFFINMPELFERFVEVKLRKVYGNLLIPGYDQSNGKAYSSWNLRPDFIVEGKGLIIDAKYKYWFENNDKTDRFKDDYQQLSLYGRLPEIKKLIGVKRDEEAKLIFIYPEITNETELTEKAFTCEYSNSVFSNIIKIPIGIKVR